MIEVRRLARNTGSASHTMADARRSVDLIVALQSHAESIGCPDVAQSLSGAREAAEVIASGRHGHRTMN